MVGDCDIAPEQITQLRCGALDESVSSADRHRQRSALAKDPFRGAADYPDKKRRACRGIAAEMRVDDRRVPVGNDEPGNKAGGDRGGYRKDHAIRPVERGRSCFEDEIRNPLGPEAQRPQTCAEADFRALVAQAGEGRLHEAFREADARQQWTARGAPAAKRLGEHAPEECG